MKRERRVSETKLAGAIACCLLSVVAASLGPTGEKAVRAAMRDASRPGLLAGDWLQQSLETFDLARWPWTVRHAESMNVATQDATEYGALESEVRQLRYELAASESRLQALAASLGPIAPEKISKTSGVHRVPARVLKDVDSSSAPGGIILDAGQSSGVLAEHLAIERIAFFEISEDQKLSEATVLDGGTVVGRTAQVGQWTSTVLPVTAREFRAHGSLVSLAPEGPRFGEQGVLEGDGKDGCILKYIPSTATVAEGDHVYSHDTSGLIPRPLYYGAVDSAVLRDGAPHWEIHIQPASKLRPIHEVQVLIPRLLESLETEKQ